MDDRSERFLQLYTPHQDALWRFVRSLVRTQHEAEDVVSETILQALEGVHRVRDDKAFLSFLFTIASRIVKRQRWRRRHFSEFSDEYAEMLHHPDAQPDVQADVTLLREALLQLSEPMRQAIVLFEISGLSIEEICHIQGGSISGVKSRLVRGRKQLAQILRVHEVHPEASTEVHTPARRAVPSLGEPATIVTVV